MVERAVDSTKKGAPLRGILPDVRESLDLGSNIGPFTPS